MKTKTKNRLFEAIPWEKLSKKNQTLICDCGYHNGENCLILGELIT